MPTPPAPAAPVAPPAAPVPPAPSTSSGQVAPAAAATSHGGVGAAIGIALVVLLVAAGGAYFFYMQLGQEQKAADAGQLAPAAPDPNSTEGIEADLNATGNASSDADLDSLEGSL